MVWYSVLTSSAKRNWQLIPLLIAAAGIFTYGVSTGATQTHYLDEWFYDRYALELAQTLLADREVSYTQPDPSGYSMTLAVVYGLYYSWGRLTNQFTSMTDFLIHFATERAPFLILGRLLSAAYAFGALLPLYGLAKRMFDWQTATLSVLLVILCYPIIFYAHLVHAMTMLIFLTVLSTYYVYHVWQRGKVKDYLLAGTCIGAGIGTKYYPALLFGTLGIAHFMRLGWTREQRDGLLSEWHKLALGLLIAFPVALLFFPVPVIDYDQWTQLAPKGTLTHATWGSPIENAWRILVGNPTYWANTAAEPVSWWANSLRTVGEVGLLWLGFGLVYCLWRYPKRWLILATPFLLLFSFITVFGYLSQGVRQLYSTLPLLWILAAAALRDLTDRLPLVPCRKQVVSIAVVVLLLIQPLRWTARYLYLASRPTTVSIGRTWLLNHLPSNAIVFVDNMVAPFGETAGWRNWVDISNSLIGREEDTVKRARARAAPPFEVVRLAYQDADSELDDAIRHGRPVFVVTTDYFSTVYWQPETLRAWGNLNAERAPFMRQYFQRIRQRTLVVHKISPREVNAFGPTVTVSRLLPGLDKDRPNHWYR